MTDSSGFEPQVGEIRAVRTFRIGPQGRLFPLYSDRAWSNEINTAQCSLAVADSESHPSPSPDCTCGFYAYGTPTAAMQYPHAKHVLAVITCWGKVIAGTRGIRAEHARLEAIWMSGRVPADLAAHVRGQYRGALVYGSREQMLDHHPPTVLDCYDDTDGGSASPGVDTGCRAALGGAVMLSLLPTAWFGGQFAAAICWPLQIALLMLSAIANGARPAGAAATRHWVQLAAVALWVLAPTGGMAGWLLIRAPLLEIALVIALARRHCSADSRQFPATIGARGRTPRRPGSHTV